MTVTAQTDSVTRRAVRSFDDLLAAAKEASPNHPVSAVLVDYLLFGYRFKERTGSWPMFKNRDLLDLNRLVEAGHSHQQISQRIENMFSAPPDWLRDSFDFQTFIRHFDKFALPCAPTTDRCPHCGK